MSNMTFIENILSKHSGNNVVKPGEIVDVEIDVRVARDFGGPNVVKNLIDNSFTVFRVFIPIPIMENNTNCASIP